MTNVSNIEDLLSPDAEILGTISPETIDLPLAMISLIGEYATRVEQIQTALVGFVAGSDETGSSWSLEITAARIVRQPQT